jgi:hypothetical protein
MKNIKLSLLSFILLLCTCSRYKDPVPHFLHGQYLLKSLTSETPVDMDFDGHYDTDWFTELKKVSNPTNEYVLQFYDESPQDGSSIAIEHLVPFAIVFQPPNRPIDRIEYAWRYTLHRVSHNNETKGFYNFRDLITMQHSGIYIPPPVFLEEIRYDETRTLFIRLRHEGVYDAKDDTWKTAYLDAVYEWYRPFR